MLRHKTSRKRPSVGFWVRCISSPWHSNSSRCLRHPLGYSLQQYQPFPTGSSNAIILVWTDDTCFRIFFLVPTKIYCFNLAKPPSRTSSFPQFPWNSLLTSIHDYSYSNQSDSPQSDCSKTWISAFKKNPSSMRQANHSEQPLIRSFLKIIHHS